MIMPNDMVYIQKVLGDPITQNNIVKNFLGTRLPVKSQLNINEWKVMGVHIDTIKGTISIPDAKLTQIKQSMVD